MTSRIVVGGFYRSGTSLVRRILDGHSRIFCGPEAKLWMDLFGQYRGDPLNHLRLFPTLRALGADDDLLVSEFGAAYVKVLDRLTSAQKKARWADKAPENVLHMHHWETLLGERFPFIHCVRDPLDTLASALEARFVYTLPTDFDELIAIYKTFIDAGLAYEVAHPIRSFRVQYENLVTSPRRVVTSLMVFLGEQFESASLDLAREERPAGLEDPKVGRHPHVHTDSVGRYRTVLSDEQVRRVRTACEEQALRLGYSW